MTSKLSFRSRALDASKPMPIYRDEEVPDLPDFAAINRGVPPLPSGMEKEEECEHHLQRAMSAQQAFGHTGELVIPTPDVSTAPNKDYSDLYPSDYVLPRQPIHMQLFAIEQNYPDYDMDSEDEEYLNKTATLYPDLNALKFETLMDKFEKNSSQNVIQLPEAKSLSLDEDEQRLVTEIYDYWLTKRLGNKAPLIPTVKIEKREGVASNNPYVAFRRRTEKMQTRKNRKNDETSYEKMLKLRRDLNRAVSLLDMVRGRERIKREQLSLTLDIFKKRYEIGDYSGQILADVSARTSTKNNGHGPGRKKREYRKRIRSKVNEELGSGSSDNEATSDQEQDAPDGVYTFRRKRGCYYHAPRDGYGNWPWFPPEEGGLGQDKYRYRVTYVDVKCVGYARRRYGRGGRIIIDRAHSPDERIDFDVFSADEADLDYEAEDCTHDFRS